jgi:mRNA interferase MazF
MRRGDIVTVAAPGDDGKPRPAVVMQGDVLNRDARSTLEASMTGHLRETPLLRLTVEPTGDNGPRVLSQAQVNRLPNLPSNQVGSPIGRLSDRENVELNRLLALVTGLA